MFRLGANFSFALLEKMQPLFTFVPQEFGATADTRVRRHLTAGPSSVPPALHDAGTKQMEFIEDNPRNLGLVGGIPFYCGGAPYTTQNPTTCFEVEEVMSTRYEERLKLQLSGYYHKDLFVLKSRSEFDDLGRAGLIELLKQTNIPASRFETLPDDQKDLQDFVYKTWNTIDVKMYGDGATLVETWPMS